MRVAVLTLALVVTVLVCCPVPASSQPAPAGAPATAGATDTPAARGEPRVEGWLSNVTRVESWRFFAPPSPEVDPNYTFAGNRMDLGLRTRGARIDLSGAFRYVRLERLPTDAIGPGPLGTGPIYYAATGLPYSYQVFVTDLSVAWHTRDRRVRVAAGRLSYTSGAEGDADGPRVPSHLAEVRALAVDGRTMGTFDWSLYQRRFDGVRADWNGARAYAGGGFFLPSQGGFEESANLTIPRIQVGTTWMGWRHAGGQAESQASAQWYRDRREIDIRPDNALLPIDRADVTVWSMGASHVRTRALGDGEADVAVWGAVQGGDWYGEAHRAWSATVQGGFEWSSAPWRPWARGGWSYASGDEAARDGRHQTWFPMLGETRPFALSMVYAPMNLRDVFAQVHVRPHARARARVDLHLLDLAQASDRWYQGSGATAREGRFFGFTTRPANGQRALGTILEGTADVRLSRYWSINGYLGRMWGGPVVRTSFVGDRLLSWYVENVLELRVGK